MANNSEAMDNRNNSELECSICFECAQQPVVSYCGHVFCWPCVYRWMDVQTAGSVDTTCPVCKAIICKERLVPIYGRDSDSIDPRGEIPPRPQGQYTEASSQYNQFSSTFSETAGRTLLASASFHIGRLGIRASMGPFMSPLLGTDPDSTWPQHQQQPQLNIAHDFNLGQVFLAELLKNIFFAISMLTFFYMLII